MSKDIPPLWLKLDNSALQRDGDGFGAILGAEFSQDAADVQLDGAFGDVQHLPDLAVAPPADQQPEHFDLPHRQFGPCDSIRKARGDFGWNVTLPGRRLPD